MHSSSVAALLKGEILQCSDNEGFEISSQHANPRTAGVWVPVTCSQCITRSDTRDVSVFRRAGSAQLCRVSKQKRFQLFSFDRWPYIIPALASVTPPSLLRNRTVSCGVQGFSFQMSQ